MSPNTEPARILIVEDESIVALDIQNSLAKLGYQVCGMASAGDEAIRLAVETQPDLILMDIRLAGAMDGIEIAAQMRSRFDTPVIYLTAHSDAETLERAKLTKPLGYLIKPFVETELKTTIEIALVLLKLEQQNQAYTRKLQQEIEERKRVEAILLASERKFRGIVEQSQDGFALVESHGIIIEWNRGNESISGIPRDDALGEFLWDIQQRLLPASARNQAALEQRKVMIQTALETGQAPWLNQLMTQEIQRSDGTQRSIEAVTFVIDTGEGVMIGSILRDVTERKQAEEHALDLALEKERTRLLVNFITDAAHAFRTPLSVIGTAAFLLRRTVDEEVKDKHASVIKQEISHLTQLIQSLAILAQLDSGLELGLELLDVNAVLKTLHAWGSDEALVRNLTISFDLSDDLPLVYGNVKQLYLAFRHVLDNAFRYTPAGGSVAICSWPETAFVIAEIQDNGRGMTEIECRRAFERFYRGDEARSTRGLGLGWAIVERIVELHKGRVDVISAPNKGSTFRISLPRG